MFLQIAQRTDDLGERLPRALAARAGHARADLNAVAPRLRSELLAHRIVRAKEKLAALWKMAELVHPDRPLSKGFARVTSRAGQTLTRAADAVAESLLTLQFADGPVDATVDAASAPRPRVERKPPRSYVPPQAGLFDEPEE